MSFTELSMHYGLGWSLLSIIFLLLAWYDATQSNTSRHRTIMIFMVLGSWLFVISYLLRYLIPGEMPSLPDPLMLTWLTVHGSIALIPSIGGPLMIWARYQKGDSSLAQRINQQHRKIGRIIIPVWLFTHMGGIANYWLLH
ncbi:MAG: DUF420 domain-containing protein [Gammaproteobacteria bacterium]|nr:DUF420 domain-containing protein [Gammaproteobacteria bacterium]MCF6230799.1 DUF420 domain-containing protein [Gammaproteobacteria bacterium]